MYFFSTASLAGFVSLAPTLPKRAPTSTVDPSFTSIFSKTPFDGDGTSTLTLSVSSSTSGSSESTSSPTDFNHFDTVASVTDSPSAGTIIFSALYLFITFSNISFCSARCLFKFPVAGDAAAFLPTYFTFSPFT